MSSSSEHHTELPVELAPDASIGEIRAEIDSARHDAAHTIAELAERFTVREQARRQVRSAMRSLSWDGRRVREDVRVLGDAIPPGFAETGRKAVTLIGRLPLWVRIGVPSLLVLRIMIRRRRARATA